MLPDKSGVSVLITPDNEKEATRFYESCPKCFGQLFILGSTDLEVYIHVYTLLGFFRLHLKLLSLLRNWFITFVQFGAKEFTLLQFSWNN